MYLGLLVIASMPLVIVLLVRLQRPSRIHVNMSGTKENNYQLTKSAKIVYSYIIKRLILGMLISLTYLVLACSTIIHIANQGNTGKIFTGMEAIIYGLYASSVPIGIFFGICFTQWLGLLHITMYKHQEE